MDCDGVLIDSEGVASRVLARGLNANGYPIGAAECERRFAGRTLSDIALELESIIGPLGSGWAAAIAKELIDALATEAVPMEGAMEFVRALVELGVPFRVASNSSREELGVKFARTGLDRLIDPSRVHSAADVIALGGRGKPAPDLFLAVATAEGVDPGDVWVVEDSPAGVAAATDAGMLCYGFSPARENPALTALGAIPLRALSDLLPLLQPDFCEA